MILALCAVGGLIALLLMARSARRAWKDQHSLIEHHRTLDTLGEIAHHQSFAMPSAPDPALVRAHVRVFDGGEKP